MFSTFLLAASFLLFGIVAGQLTGSGILSGFMLIYAGMAAFLGVVGYAALFIGRAIGTAQNNIEST